jgi:hypothetical protein
MTKAWQLVQSGWCQGVSALDSQGNGVVPESPSASRWCIHGALSRVYGEGTDDAHFRLAKSIGFWTTIHWNDDPNRTQAEVVEALKKADL